LSARSNAVKKFAVFAIVAIALFPLLFDYWNIQLEKFERVLWKRVTKERSVSLGKMEILGRYDTVCVLEPRAIRSDGKQPADAAERSQKALDELFGEISFKAYEEELIKRHTYRISWTIYAVRSNKVVKSFPLKYTEDFGYEMDSGFKSGCYTKDSVCVREKDSSDSEKRILLIGQCKE
jgi:hypothetical protein